MSGPRQVEEDPHHGRRPTGRNRRYRRYSLSARRSFLNRLRVQVFFLPSPDSETEPSEIVRYLIPYSKNMIFSLFVAAYLK